MELGYLRWLLPSSTERVPDYRNHLQHL